MSLTLPASLTLRDAATAVPQLLADLAREPAGQAHLDATALGQVDSATLAALLAARRAAQAQGRQWQLTGCPPHLLELAQLYGVSELLGLQAA